MRPAELGTVRLMNLIADCSTTQGRSGERRLHGSSHGDPRPDECGLSDEQRDHDPRELGVAQLAGDRVEADLGKPRDEDVGREDQRGHESVRPSARTRRRGAISGSASRWPLRRRARRSLRSTSCVRARSRRCGVSAARCRYGSTRATESDHPAFDGLAQRAFRADENASTRRAARPRRCRARIAAHRASRPTGRPASVCRRTTITLLALSLPCEMPAVVQQCDLPPSAPRAARRSPRRGSRARAGSRSGWRVTSNASPSGPRPAVTTSGTRTPACAAIRVVSASCSTCSSRPTGALRGGSR